MDTHSLPSKLLDTAVGELASLPGIGRKTALRLALHLLKQPAEQVNYFGNAIIAMRNEVKQCRVCCNISDSDTCEICANPNRESSTICVVENVQDVMSIEATLQYNGLYHVLGGVISPMDGISPGDLNIASLLERVAAGDAKEAIIAISTTMEGETTAYYLYKKLSAYPIKISALARGVEFGNELEHTDEITLGRSIKNRTPFENLFGHKG
ncbi:recombination protein RecR [Bacteroidia bacterium]|nr:recombination protein RecR [Bacteroidia bacterium]